MNTCRIYNCKVISVNAEKVIFSYGKDKFSQTIKDGLWMSRELNLIPMYFKAGDNISLHENDFITSSKLD